MPLFDPTISSLTKLNRKPKLPSQSQVLKERCFKSMEISKASNINSKSCILQKEHRRGDSTSRTSNGVNLTTNSEHRDVFDLSCCSNMDSIDSLSSDETDQLVMPDFQRKVDQNVVWNNYNCIQPWVGQNSNNMSEALTQGRYKGKGKHPSMQPKIKTSASSSKTSKKSKQNAVQPCRETNDLQDAAKKIMKVSPENDQEVMMDMISLVNPEISDILKQMQSNKPKKRAELTCGKSADTKLELAKVEDMERIIASAQDKYDKLKEKAIRLRTQYTQKSSKLKQLQNNMRILIDRYKEFKRIHENCDDQRLKLKNQLVEVVNSNEESEQLVREFNETRILYADKIKTLQEENKQLKCDLEEQIAASRQNESEDIALREELERKTEQLSKITDDLKEKQETIQNLAEDLKISQKEGKKLIQEYKRNQEQLINLNSSIQQKDFELSEMKMKIKMQDKTIKHLQLAYNLVLTDQDISNKINNDKKCRVSGDATGKGLISKGSSNLPMNYSNNAGNNHEQIENQSSTNEKQESENLTNLEKKQKNRKHSSFNLDNKPNNGACSSKDEDLIMKHLYFSAANSFTESESSNYDFSGLDLALNNSHSVIPSRANEQTGDGFINSTADNFVGHPNLKRDFERNEHDEMEALSVTQALEITDANLENTVIVETCESRNIKSMANFMADEIFDRIKISDQSHKNHLDDCHNEATKERVARPRGIRKIPSRRSRSVPKHVTFACTADEQFDDAVSFSEKLRSTEKLSSNKFQDEGAHPLLCRRRKSESNPNLHDIGSNDYNYNTKIDDNELVTIQRKLDSLNDVIQTQEKGIQFLREKIASFTEMPKNDRNTDAEIKILSIVNSYGRPIPDLCGFSTKSTK